jgi:tetratricopeptide (TPR) repeat protein
MGGQNSFIWSDSHSLDPNLKLRTILDRAVVRITRKFDRYPLVEAGIRGTIGQTYIDLGLYADAQKQLKRALQLYRQVWGAEHPGIWEPVNSLGRSLYLQGKYSEAEALFTKSLGAHTMRLLQRHETRFLEGQYELYSMSYLAKCYYAQGKYAQAEAIEKATLENRRRVMGPEHPLTLVVLADLVSMYQRQGRYALAETYGTDVLVKRRNVLGAEHPDTMVSAADLALAYLSQGRFAESESLSRGALDVDRKNQPEDWQRFRAESLQGVSMAGQKKYAKAEPLLVEGYQQMVARKDRIGVPDWYHLELGREWLVKLYEAWGKPEKAAKWRKR